MEKVEGAHLQHTYCPPVCQSVSDEHSLASPFLLSGTARLLQCMKSRESVIRIAVFVTGKRIPHFSFDIRTCIYRLLPLSSIFSFFFNSNQYLFLLKVNGVQPMPSKLYSSSFFPHTYCVIRLRGWGETRRENKPFPKKVKAQPSEPCFQMSYCLYDMQRRRNQQQHCVCVACDSWKNITLKCLRVRVKIPPPPPKKRSFIYF